MNILIVHNEYGWPSGEEFALQDIEGLLKAAGHEVRWFRRSSAEIQGAAGAVTAFFAGIHNPRACRALKAMLREWHPDAALVQNLYPFLSPSVIPVLRRAGVPVMMRCPNYRLFCPGGLHLSHGAICEKCIGGREYWCVLRNCEGNRFKSLGYALRGFAARITGRILNHVNRFIVLSEFQKKRFVEQGIAPERIDILPNVSPAAPEVAGGLGEQVTFVGRVSVEKGIEDFVEAARLLPDISFAVAGATGRMPDLPACSPGNIQWLGFLNESDLNEAYLRSRILVFPSRWFEGFPNVMTRAMLLRRPVIASRIGALPEIVDEGITGLLHTPCDAADLAAKIRELYNDPARCINMGRAGREKVLKCYSPEVVGRTLEEILKKTASPFIQ